MATDQQKQLSRNKSLTLIGVLLLLVGVGGTWQFLAPQLLQARDTLETEKAKLRGLESDVAALTTAKLQLEQTTASMRTERGVNFDRLPLVFPKTEDVPGLYLQLEALVSRAADGGLNNPRPVYQVSAPITDSTNGGVTIPVAVTAVGDYLSLKQFVSDLELNLRPLSIQTINLAQNLDRESGTASGLFTLNVAAVVRAETLSPSYSSSAP